MRSLAAVLAVLALVLTGASCKKSVVAPGTNPLSGAWTGTLSQSNGVTTNTFTYRMSLSQTGTQVTGTAHIELPNQSQYYADFSVTGTMAGNVFTFLETAITAQTTPPSGGIWCIKNGTLQLTATPRSLSGSWMASNCVNPGTIELH